MFINEIFTGMVGGHWTLPSRAKKKKIVIFRNQRELVKRFVWIAPNAKRKKPFDLCSS